MSAGRLAHVVRHPLWLFHRAPGMKRVVSQARQLALGAMIALAGCGSSPKQAEGGTPTLRVADQLKTVRSVLEAAGEANPPGYKIEWSNFLGGPAVIAAQTGGSVDVGWMAETPLVFAQAAGSPVTVVAVGKGVHPAGSNVALVTVPNSPIRRAADLKGKSVGYTPGTITQYLVASVLASAGLSLNDVKPVRIAALNPEGTASSQVDAFSVAEPQLTQFVNAGKLRVLAYGGEPYTPGFAYLVAANAALADPKRAALIGDFVSRVARATRWQREHLEEATPAFAKSYNISPDLAGQILARTASRYAPIDANVVAAHQKEADLFFKLGTIRKPVDAGKLFDRRYNDLVAQADSGK